MQQKFKHQKKENFFTKIKITEMTSSSLHKKCDCARCPRSLLNVLFLLSYISNDSIFVRENKIETVNYIKVGKNFSSLLMFKMKFMNIEFAPLNVSLERRLQTLSVALIFLMVTSSIQVSICIIIGVFVYGYQWMKFLMIGYLVYCCFDRNRCKRGRSWYV